MLFQMLNQSQTAQERDKPPEKVGRGAQMKRKKLPVKITDKTRFSALIIDDPEKTTGSSNPQTVETGVSRDSGLVFSGTWMMNYSIVQDSACPLSVIIAKKLTLLATTNGANGSSENVFRKQSYKNPQIGTMNSDMSFESTVHIGSAENRPGLPYNKIQNPVSATQKRPRIFESSLPAGPILPPKNHDVSCRQPLGPANSRPPDYSEFSRNFARNSTHREVSLPPLSVLPSQRMSDQASNGCQNFQGGRTRRSSSVVPQPVISSPKTNIQQNHSAMELHDMLRTARIKIFLFSKKAKEGKEWNNSSEHLKGTQSQEELKEPARKQSRPAEPVELNTVLKEEAIPMEMSEKSTEDTIINLSSDKDNTGEEGDQDDEAVPILLNLFSDKDAVEPMLFDPRVKPAVDLCASDKSRNDWRNTEDEVVQEKSMEICRDSDGSRVSSGIEKKWKRHRHHHYHLRTPRSYTRGTRSRKSHQRRSRSRKSCARRCCCSRLSSVPGFIKCYLCTGKPSSTLEWHLVIEKGGSSSKILILVNLMEEELHILSCVFQGRILNSVCSDIRGREVGKSCYFAECERLDYGDMITDF
uniref:Uncharacterized protein n=1 Tax=Setaria digitata TaxID=48799 RepID=A0A915Q4W6_9BILA